MNKSHKEAISPSKILIASGTLLVASQGLTFAADTPEVVDPLTPETTSEDLQTEASVLLAQTTPVLPAVSLDEPGAQFSPPENPPLPQVPGHQAIAEETDTTAKGSNLSEESVPEAESVPVEESTSTEETTPTENDTATVQENNEPIETVAAPSTDAVSYTAEDLEIPARFGVNASTATNGFGETVGVHGFVPLDQDISDDLNESDVTFLEGDLQVNDGDPSFSLNLGHRGYRQDDEDPDNEYIRGGYVGVDGRFTDESTFFQLASGYERISDDWEVRINGYLPLGDRTNTIRSVDFDTGLQTNSGFEGNQLVLSAVRERQRILQQEESLGGFDAEFGTELAEWDGGELMGYAGGYLLSGEDSSLGGQLRLAANFESNFNAGLSLQHDGLFGTTVALSLSATWPEVRFQDEDENTFEEEYEVPIRLRDPIARRDNVAINVINEEEIILEEEIEPLRNPEEEEDYRFIHVALGAPQSDSAADEGTYENPFTTVEDAITLINSEPTTYSDGNTIVYVDGEVSPGTTIPGFTIPERVRVLSQGPEQIIAGMEFSSFPSTATRLPFSAAQNFNVSADFPNANGITVSLPDSNDGVFPTITGGTADDLVTLGNNTVLAGFQIDGATQHGVTGNGIDNVELRNNLISNSGSSGVFLNNVGGNAILFDNVIDNSADRGIFVENTTTDRPIQVTIAGFDLDNNRVGMDFSSIATADTEFPSQIISVGPSTDANTSIGTPGSTPLTNSILNSTAEGLVLRAEGDSLFAASTQQLRVSDATIDASGSDGVQVIADVGAHQQEFSMDNGAITNSGGNGITIINGDTAINGGTTLPTPDGVSAQEVVIIGNEIANSALDGINVALVGAGAQELVIRDNQIINNGGDGIDSVTRTASVQEWRTNTDTGELGISGNIISGNGGQAITIDLENVSALPVLGIGNNDLSGNGAGPDIDVNTSNTLPGGDTNACLIITNNTTPNGVQVTAPDPDPFFSGTPTPSVLVQNLADAIANATVFQHVDFFGTTTTSTDAFTNETGGCIQ